MCGEKDPFRYTTRYSLPRYSYFIPTLRSPRQRRVTTTEARIVARLDALRRNRGSEEELGQLIQEELNRTLLLGGRISGNSSFPVAGSLKKKRTGGKERSDVQSAARISITHEIRAGRFFSTLFTSWAQQTRRHPWSARPRRSGDDLLGYFERWLDRQCLTLLEEWTPKSRMVQ